MKSPGRGDGNVMANFDCVPITRRIFVKSFFSFTLILSALLLCLLFAGCDDGSSNDNSSDDDANNDANDDVNDDTASPNDDDTDGDDDEESSTPYEFAPSPSDDIGIFVAKTGNDDNPGTMELPKLTISAGVEAAEHQSISLPEASNYRKFDESDITGLPYKSVFVAQGDYNESVVVQDVSLFGGYAGSWKRDIKEYATSIIATEEIGLTATSCPVVEGFNIFGGEWGEENPIINATGLLITHYSIISNCRIYGGRADDITTGIECDDCALVLYNSSVFGSSIDLMKFTEIVHSPLTTVGINAPASPIVVNSVIHGGISENGIFSIGLDGGDWGELIIVGSYIYGGDPMGIESSSIGLRDLDGDEYYVKAHYIVNNIIDGGAGVTNATAVYIKDAWNISMFNNNIWGASTDCLFGYSSEHPCLNSITEINRLGSYIFGRRNTISGNISMNPLLAGPENGYWPLSPESPCLDAGIDAWIYWHKLYEDSHKLDDFDYFCEKFHFDTVLKYDFEGEPRNSVLGWDIGPDEWWPNH